MVPDLHGRQAMVERRSVAQSEPGLGSPARPFVPVMLQDWRDLLFLHWRVEPTRLERLLPSSLAVETLDAAAWVGLVPFRVERARPPLVPGFAAARAGFGEVNVRTYVRPVAGGPPGVWFMSLDAGSPLAVAGARVVYRLPYFAASVRFERDGERLRFRSERGEGSGRCDVVWRPTGPEIERSAPGSLDEFLIERYVLYTEHRGRLLRADVRHRPYPLRRAELIRFQQDLVARAGVEVAGAPIVHSSRGVDVRVSAPRGVRRTLPMAAEAPRPARSPR